MPRVPKVPKMPKVDDWAIISRQVQLAEEVRHSHRMGVYTKSYAKKHQ